MAVSGGVDSSTAAWLLKKQGYTVIGVFTRLGGYAAEKSESAARQVCRYLGIRFYPVNLASKFKREIIDYFLSSYERGLTPNPCVKCNRVIKFGELLRLAGELGAEYLATGHYARLWKEKKRFKLYRGRDAEKDQSYFLYGLDQGQLKHILFPLGGCMKDEIKKIAEREKLPCLSTESQDICFLNQDGKILEHSQYLKRYLKLKPGPIKTLAGEEIGRHQGLPLYTIGQRRGVEIGGTGPYYVVRADYANNTLYATNNPDDPTLFGKELLAREVNWISGQEPKLPLNCRAAIRYRHQAVGCKVSKHAEKGGKPQYKVKFKQPQRAITPGQSVVFYQNKEVLGGGIIEF